MEIRNKEMKYIFTGMVALILLLWWIDPLAHGINVDNSVTNNYHSTPEAATINTSGMRSSDYDAMAAAVAASMAAGSCQFDYSTAMQGCGSTWNYDGEWGINFQVGKRVDELLINGGVACSLLDGDVEECGFGGAVNWHF